MKDLINILIWVIAIFLFASCEGKANITTSNKISVDSLNMINDSTFISKIKAFSIVNNKEKIIGTLQYIIKDTPTQTNPYYIIQVGKMNSYRLEIYYNFYCYPKTGKVKLYDTLNDTLIDTN